MAKLYPPQIEGTIPAFYTENNNTIITVPFMMNQVVSRNEISTFIIKIKSILNNEVLYSGYASSFNFETCEAYFNLNKISFLKKGEYYKIQIAYVNNSNTVGYFSTVAIGKYTTKPKMEIVNLVAGELHNAQYTYTGKYSQQNQDTTEKLYSYEFIIYDSQNNVYDTSGEQLHNHEKDENNYESIDEYVFTKTLKDDYYYLVYKGTTSNGMKVSSPRYKIYVGETVEPSIQLDIIVEMDYENAISTITLESPEKIMNGNFVLSRASSKDNFSNWIIIKKYKFLGKIISDFKEVDFTLDHGYSYQYSIQQVNSQGNIISNRIKSNIIEALFEHCYLFDGERQLKIAFNPKITSFKETLLESKTNSIGGKYPTFFRNGQVRYKEFGISGLISYHTDENEYFLTNEDLALDDYSHFNRQQTLKPNISANDLEYFYNQEDLAMGYMLKDLYEGRDKQNSEYTLIKNQHARTQTLEHHNFVAERVFKLKVLEFLNNGKPKLFRSAAEGSYIVQLLNSSLSPNDQLGRMLHTFTTSASEVADLTNENLQKYGFIKQTEVEYIVRQLQYKTIDMPISSKQLRLQGWSPKLNTESIVDLKCFDMFFGDQILINGETVITIGTTGTYEVRFDDPINSIQVKYPISESAKITYGFWSDVDMYFDNYKSIQIIDVPCTQIINEEDPEKWLSLNSQINKHIDTKTEQKLVKYYKIHFYKNLETIQDLYETNNNLSDFLIKIIYKDNSNSEDIINIKYKDDYYLNDLSNIYDIEIGKNVVANITYQKKVIEYVEEVFNNEESSS